jgi:hypothetical protein
MFVEKKPDPIRQRAKSEMGHIIRRQLEAMRSHEVERRSQEAERKEK